MEASPAGPPASGAEDRHLAPDEELGEVAMEEQEARSSLLVVESKSASPDELLQQYKFQYRSLDTWAPAEELPVVWSDAEGVAVSLRGDHFLAFDIPVGGPVAVQLRIVQRQLPDSLSAWSDWFRNARKDAEAWLSRTSLPVLVGTLPPEAPSACLEASAADGFTLVVRLRWKVPSWSSELLGNTATWQYRWRLWDGTRSDTIGTQGDNGSASSTAAEEGSGVAIPSGPADAASLEVAPSAARGAEQCVGPAWHLGPELEDVVSPEGACESPWLRDGWDGAIVVCCVRYRTERCATWSEWSVPGTPFDVRLAPPRPRVLDASLRVSFRPSDPTAAELQWTAFAPACPHVYALQYQVQICGGEPTDDEAPASSAKPVGVSGLDSPSDSPFGDAICSRGSGLVEQWVTVCTMEQRAGAAEPPGAAGGLMCCLNRLSPLTRYKARLRVRHWRLDKEFGAGLTCEFTTPATGAELGVHPLRAMPDAVLPSEYRDSANPWFAFWLPAVVAQWPPTSVFFEWVPMGARCADDAAQTAWWEFVHAERVVLRTMASDDHLLKGGCAVCVQLPPQHEELSLRCRHLAGMVTSAVRVVPRFDPPSAVEAALHVDDQGLAVLLTVRADGHGCGFANRCQFAVATPASDPDGGGRWHELPMVSTTPESCGATARHWLRAEDPCSPLRALSTHCFRARVGDDLRWSEWSEPSPALVLSVPPPCPSPGAALTARDLPEFAVELHWLPFVAAPGLSCVDYHVDAAPTSSPDDAVVQFILGALAESDGTCRATLRRLVPGTEYAISVCASYPKLGRFCEEHDVASVSLTTIFTPPSLDCLHFEPPAPLAQLTPPASHGGLAKRMPWGWDFWLEVDRRGFREFSESESSSYQVQWRAMEANGNHCENSESTWAPARLQLVGSEGVEGMAVGHVVCRWDIAEQVGSWHIGSTEKLTAPPERVQLRLRLDGEPLRIGTTPRLWFSRASPPFVTAFAPPPKPRSSLRVAAHGQLEVQVSFVMSGLAPSKGTALPEWVRADAAGAEDTTPVPVGLPPIPDTYGHRFATRFQLRHRLAGVQHAGQICEMEQRDLDRRALRSSESDEAVPTGWLLASASLQARRPDFANGERRIFSVRIGDGWRWSAWSAFSKPVTVELPPVQLVPAVPSEEASFSAWPQPPDALLLEWPPVTTELGVAIECAFWVVAVQSDGRETADCRQLLLTSIVAADADHTDVQQRRRLVKCGHLRQRHHYSFLMQARPVSGILGAVDFQDFLRTEAIEWPEASAGDEDASAHNLIALESWDLPVPRPLAVPGDLEARSGLWRGRAVLLAWPKGMAIGDDLPLELQACADGDDPVAGWVQVVWSVLRHQERPYIVAAPLHFVYGRLRWYSRDRRIAGPRGELCVASVEPPAEPHAEVFCTKFAVRVRVRVAVAMQGHGSMNVCEIRCQQVRVATDGDGCAEKIAATGDWLSLPEEVLDAMPEGEAALGQTFIDATFGEDDGLELGRRYVFSARLGDVRRRSPWSGASSSVVFSAPVPVAPNQAEDNPLLVEALTPSSVRFWWRELRGPAVLSPRGHSPGGVPQLEYRLDVSRCLDNGGLERQATALLEDAEDGTAPFEAKVCSLAPGARYFAALAVRLARIGGRRWCKTGLKASFEMPSAILDPP